MRDDPTVIALVTRVRKGDQSAWDELVDRYIPLVWSVCGRFRLERPDSDDVVQTVWLRLLEHLVEIRDPAALPGWLATATRRECLRVLREARKRQSHEHSMEPEMIADLRHVPAGHELDLEVERAELNAILTTALQQLHPRDRQFLILLAQDPPIPYARISEQLQMPIGSIGPTRARCLAKLRRYPPLAAFYDSQFGGE